MGETLSLRCVCHTRKKRDSDRFLPSFQTLIFQLFACAQVIDGMMQARGGALQHGMESMRSEEDVSEGEDASAPSWAPHRGAAALRDRDADVEYWQQDSQQKSQQLAVAAREIQALERQVIALGGTLDPYRMGPPVAEAPELDSFEGGRGYGASERAGSSVLHASGAM